MKKIICLVMGFVLSINLIGCTNKEDQTVTSKPSTSERKKPEAHAVIFENKDKIKSIELKKLSKNDIIKTTNKDTIKSVVSAIENSKPTNISLDQKTKNAIRSHMIVKYENGSEETFFVWMEENLEIMIAESTDETNTIAFKIDNTNFKQAIDFLKK
ncbi:hypothetical protein [Bacillus cereus]|uniref:hypothetical protein n=1 Tax=Bacillus cereus TaxID=1396 RepID=UPI000BF712EA|nr:hypothetical protein [Bacillus cereus]PER01902.1 hypothetical protein CN483_07770 [Bacillus cereus]PEX04039.1 hypothetical protein CN453_06650 [Bacillus cereus]PEY37656.1 hypothetical protein CN336_24455 [Bacillus cereus]PFL30900.1 hypothetical protein COJ16_25135 [Bacillus cereus]PGL10345.1 hypothetical protein CN915_12180 [Bacillus cereus]